jgi:adenine/guanine phosphoribosyltransferase-like PRPP-binding protein
MAAVRATVTGATSAVADAGTIICPVCSGSAHGGFGLCFCCATLVRQLRLPLAPVVAIVDYRIGDRVHRRLRGYKDAPVAEARRAHTVWVASLLDAYLADHGAWLRHRFGAGWDVVATVPSSARPAGAPFDAVVARVPRLDERRRSLLVRGPEPTDHLVASRHGFTLAGGAERDWLRRRRVLVVDDSVTTGARAQSAVAALRLAGARVTGVLVVGRVLAPEPG